MEIACQDLAASAVEADLRNRQRRLADRYQLLRQSVKENERLAGIAEKYRRQVEAVRDMKEKQRLGLERISDYVERLGHDTSLTETLLAQTAVDQRRVMDQIQTLTRDMDYLTSDVK